jgi:acyl transferase domain-containing protein
MQPAADKMAQALASVTIRPLVVPVLANVTAREANNPDHVRQLLVEQVTGRVRWRESILALRGLTVDTTVEFGGNKILTGMVKRIDKELASITLRFTADLEALEKPMMRRPWLRERKVNSMFDLFQQDGTALPAPPVASAAPLPRPCTARAPRLCLRAPAPRRWKR